jgi:hypothetical protein
MAPLRVARSIGHGECEKNFYTEERAGIGQTFEAGTWLDLRWFFCILGSVGRGRLGVLAQY